MNNRNRYQILQMNTVYQQDGVKQRQFYQKVQYNLSSNNYMEVLDCPQDNPRQSVVEVIRDEKMASRYTSNQFYPRSKSKAKKVELIEQNKARAVVSFGNKSAFSEPQFHNDSRISNTIQAFTISQSQNPSPQLRQRSSFTVKIVQQELKNSNLLRKANMPVGGKSPQRFHPRIYEEIQMYQNSEYRVRPINAGGDVGGSNRYKQGLRNKQNLELNDNKKMELNNNEKVSTSLYQSLPQPFVHKKQLVSFDQPINYLKSREQKRQQQRNKLTSQKDSQLKSIQINNIQQGNYLNKQQHHMHRQDITIMIQEMAKFSNDYNSIIQSVINKKSKYQKKKLQPLKVNPGREKMSNNIKDYLSVERIKIKEMESKLLAETTNTSNEEEKPVKLEVKSPDKLVNQEQQLAKTQHQTNTLPRKSVFKQYSTVCGLQKAKPVKFTPPFPLYYYRDFIWKVGFSNEFIVESPQQYDARIKVYLGKGNNSNLIRGLIKRRPWYQITDKYQEAHFVWTQIKIQPYFTLQKKTQKQLQYQQIDSQLTQQSKTLQSSQTLNDLQKIKFQSYWIRNFSRENKFKDSLKARSKMMGLKEISLSQVIPNMKIHNHFVNNYVIGNKKALFSLMSSYYRQIGQSPFNYLPLTFHIKNGIEDDEYLKFLQQFYAISKEIKKMQDFELNSYIYKHNAWIVKPGENTNRGNGIIVCLTLNEIKVILKKKEKHNDGTNKTYILQKYIEKPLLYKKRKFDLRHYMMMSCTNGIVKGYWYKEGYVRTTSAEYTLKFSSGSVHLTNDAVQKQLPDYGRFEKGNKISYEELNQYMKKTDSGFDFNTIILTKMKKIATDLITASARLMDPLKRQNNFEIFGLDFMIDEAYNVWLIQCNSNPCLELSCPLLGKIIPKMVENTFRICLDPIFVPPLNFAPKSQQFYQNINEANNFELVYDERNDKNICKKVENIELLQNKEFQEDDDTFDDDGQAWDD